MSQRGGNRHLVGGRGRKDGRGREGERRRERGRKREGGKERRGGGGGGRKAREGGGKGGREKKEKERGGGKLAEWIETFHLTTAGRCIHNSIYHLDGQHTMFTVCLYLTAAGIDHKGTTHGHVSSQHMLTAATTTIYHPANYQARFTHAHL